MVPTPRCVDMTSTAEVGYDNGKVTIDADAGKLYYEGTLDSKVMPWKFDIHYYIDGKEYSPEEIGGKSGALKITMTVRKNDECSGSFLKIMRWRLPLRWTPTSAATS